MRKMCTCTVPWVGLLLAVVLVIPACSDDTGTHIDPNKSDDGTALPDMDGGVPVPDMDKPTPDMLDTSCRLVINSINGKSVDKLTGLVPDDDRDAKTAGLQAALDVLTYNLDAGKQVTLTISGVGTSYTSATNGKRAVFTGVTFGTSISAVILKASVPGTTCKESQVQLSLRPPVECNVISPSHGSTLGASLSKSTPPPFVYDVRVATFNGPATSATISLNGTTAGTPKTPDPITGVVVFSDVQIPLGANRKLVATVSDGTVARSCEAVFTVDTTAPSCAVSFSPEPLDLVSAEGYYGFGQAQDASSTTAGLQTDVLVKTSGGGVNVTLDVDGLSLGTATAVGGVATFKGVTMLEGKRKISATCVETATGNAGSHKDIPALVDVSLPAAVDTAAGLSCKVSHLRNGRIEMSWISVADQSGGAGVSHYEVRYREQTACTDANWDDTATKVANASLQAFPVGATQSVTWNQLPRLPVGHKYYFCVKAVDKVKNASATVGQCPVLDLSFRGGPTNGVDIGNAVSGVGAVMAAADVNCDGHTDIVVGDPTAYSGYGIVYIYLGTSVGMPKTPYKLISGTQAGAKFGAGLAVLPNFSGLSKACNDLAVYAPGSGGSNGKVYAYVGRTDFFDREDVTKGTGADVIYELGSSAAASDHIGAQIVNAGDMDKDGNTDLAMTYTRQGTSGPEAGVLVVYGGGLSRIASNQLPTRVVLPGGAGVQVDGGSVAASFGASMSMGRDLDGDGYDDFVVGAPATAVSGTPVGAVHIVMGAKRAATLPETLTLGATAGSRIVTITGGPQNSSFGHRVVYVGDMNSDKLPELAVSDPGYSGNTGIVYLFQLDTSKPPSTVADAHGQVTHGVTGAAGTRLGATMADSGSLLYNWPRGGDVTGDARADLLVGTEGNGSAAPAVYVVAGKGGGKTYNTKSSYYVFEQQGSTAFGTSVVLARDIDGQGFIDVVIGDPSADSGAGRFYTYY